MLEEAIITNLRDDEYYYLSTEKEDVIIPILEDTDPDHLCDNITFGNYREYAVVEDQLQASMLGNMTAAHFAGEYVITFEFNDNEFVLGDISNFTSY